MRISNSKYGNLQHWASTVTVKIYPVAPHDRKCIGRVITAIPYL